ncbi:hypothetical protein [Paraburkholderia sp.]|uniref:hypothetical protein n=1 Tax=Paraburkholderia sp. TaxID=1926495 RepID=UPI0039E3B5D6
MIQAYGKQRAKNTVANRPRAGVAPEPSKGFTRMGARALQRPGEITVQLPRGAAFQGFSGWL